MFFEDNARQYLYLNDMPDQDAINQEIIRFLSTPEYFPGRDIRRLINFDDNTTNFFTITTLDTESLESLSATYFTPLRDAFIDITIVKNGVEIDAQFSFRTFEAENGMYEGLSDSYLDEELDSLKNDGEQLIEVDLDDVFLQNTGYVGANFFMCQLRSAQFTDTKFMAANFTSASLQDTNFTRADLRYAELIDASLTQSSLVGANLRYANLNGVDFSGADLSGAD
jgi:uncharacterized protein YjbI with pentapeptide repeats